MTAAEGLSSTIRQVFPDSRSSAPKAGGTRGCLGGVGRVVYPRRPGPAFPRSGRNPMPAPAVRRASAPVVYPESDGQPTADNTRQFRWIVTIAGNLAALFRDRDDV